MSVEGLDAGKLLETEKDLNVIFKESFSVLNMSGCNG